MGKDATLGQARKILDLVAQSGRSAEWVQEHLLGSGALSDLLQVNKLGKMGRDTRRRFFGLPSLNPPLLEEIGTVIVSATIKPFVAHDKVVIGNAGIVYVGEQFKAQFFGKTEEPIAETTLRVSKLAKSSVDSAILAELGGKTETMLAQIFALMERQKNGEEGVLLTNGWANIFYVRDLNGELRAVGIHWCEGGWGVSAGSVTFPSRWDDGHRVFSSNS